MDLVRAAATAGLPFWLACSSVPDVTYLDDDASTSGGPNSSANYSCPDNPPPAGRGVCCGERLCLRCSESHCSRCEREACDGDEACCARTPGNVECRRQSLCN
jgi:hypothetical protein